MSYIDFEAPDSLKTKTLDFIKKVVDKRGKIKKGMNECTKAIERGVAKIIIIAGDISPAEIVMHLPKIAQEKKIPYMFVNTKAELGKSANIKVPCSALAVIELPKEAEADLKAIESDVSKLKK
jgi:large subunit ribosomal protein L7Ae